ncbi:MAG: methyltransferase domain-containing protein [Gemmatimonadota bacterium]
MLNALKCRLESSPAFMQLYKSLYGAIENRRVFSDLYQHDKLLADEVRISAYRRAIEKYIGEGDVVIDLGTGTGVLAFMAARRKPAAVYAIDHSRIIEKARLVAERNGIHNVRFVRTGSRTFRPPRKADLIIQEQIGEHLFDENMVDTLLDARARLLKRGGKILPSRFRFFAEPVQLRDDCHVPFAWQQNIAGVDYGALRGTSRLGTKYYRRFVEPREVAEFLCMPEPLITFDLQTLAPGELPRVAGYRRRARRDGRLDGFCVFFEAWFDDEISFGNSPRSARTHWAIPLLRVESRPCGKGDSLSFELRMGDPAVVATWSWTSDGRTYGSSD